MPRGVTVTWSTLGVIPWLYTHATFSTYFALCSQPSSFLNHFTHSSKCTDSTAVNAIFRIAALCTRDTPLAHDAPRVPVLEPHSIYPGRLVPDEAAANTPTLGDYRPKTMYALFRAGHRSGGAQGRR
jgi:hypothetical protein